MIEIVNTHKLCILTGDFNHDIYTDPRFENLMDKFIPPTTRLPNLYTGLNNHAVIDHIAISKDLGAYFSSANNEIIKDDNSDHYPVYQSIKSNTVYDLDDITELSGLNITNRAKYIVANHTTKPLTVFFGILEMNATVSYDYYLTAYNVSNYYPFKYAYAYDPEYKNLVIEFIYYLKNHVTLHITVPDHYIEIVNSIITERLNGYKSRIIIFPFNKTHVGGKYKIKNYKHIYHINKNNYVNFLINNY